ncbi:hypothetical protein JI739_05935 [Ramlibacter sp. AW1]|uniref:DUF1439 domain-containing protein n=1 Tax=Ramlibacter aurantiacus TaxID=2801330 RepID=A0A936ZLH8_9BURK|nr:hypothetical protein [Ramlibacter aurantiacus]MBL0419881.1 hypothetical protein [Ramlibacter aurantiacus]
MPLPALTLRESRRHHLRTLAACAMAGALAGCAGLGTPRHFEISTARLERKLQERVPLRHSLLGVVNLQARVDRLRTLPEQDRLAAEMRFDASGALLPQPWHGTFDLLFGLQVDPEDFSVRMRNVELASLKLPMVMGRSAELLQGALSAIAHQFASDTVLYRMEPGDVERLRSLGLRPEPIRVTSQGLSIDFARSGGTYR